MSVVGFLRFNSIILPYYLTSLKLQEKSRWKVTGEHGKCQNIFKDGVTRLRFLILPLEMGCGLCSARSWREWCHPGKSPFGRAWLLGRCWSSFPWSSQATELTVHWVNWTERIAFSCPLPFMPWNRWEGMSDCMWKYSFIHSPSGMWKFLNHWMQKCVLLDTAQPAVEVWIISASWFYFEVCCIWARFIPALVVKFQALLQQDVL